MNKFILIHNPKCSKSRKSLEILKENSFAYEVILYLEKGLDEDLLITIFKALKMKPKNVLRYKEEICKNLTIDFDDDNQVIKAIIQYPIILERPILIHNDRAVIGRPTENIESFIEEIIK